MQTCSPECIRLYDKIVTLNKTDDAIIHVIVIIYEYVMIPPK